MDYESTSHEVLLDDLCCMTLALSEGSVYKQFLASTSCKVDKMAKENIPPPTRFDDQLVPVKAHLPYGKSNLLLDLQKLQKNHIFRISEAKSGVYRFQLDKKWFPLNADILREALEITPVELAHTFVSPPMGEQVIDFVNELGYPECLTGKTSRSDKPIHPALQMLWGIVTRLNVDYAELLWEEFLQGIQTCFSHLASLSIPSKKHNIHRRPESPIHVTSDDFPLGNLKFIPKGEKDEVFRKPIPKELITEAIQTSPYYQQYLDMVARKPTAKRDEP
ncbi:hypothetical protein Tco_1330046 [Tanacetum coccineum]